MSITSTTNRYLVIPDCHSDLGNITFVEQNIEMIFENVDKIIFLGDYIDGYLNEDIHGYRFMNTRSDFKLQKSQDWSHKKFTEKLISSSGFSKDTSDIIKGVDRKECEDNVIAYLERFKHLKERYPDKIILLIGNHDLAYMTYLTTDIMKYNNEKKFPSLVGVTRMYINSPNYIVECNGIFEPINQRNPGIPFHVNERISRWFLDNYDLFEAFWKSDGKPESINSGIMFSHNTINEKFYEELIYGGLINLPKEDIFDFMIKHVDICFDHEFGEESPYFRNVIGHKNIEPEFPIIHNGIVYTDRMVNKYTHFLIREGYHDYVEQDEPYFNCVKLIECY